MSYGDEQLWWSACPLLRQQQQLQGGFMSQVSMGATSQPPQSLRDRLVTVNDTLDECIKGITTIGVCVQGNEEPEKPCEPPHVGMNSLALLIGDAQVKSVTLRNKILALVNEL